MIYYIPKLFGIGLDTWFWTLLIIAGLEFFFILLTIVKGGAALINMIISTWLGKPLIAVVRKDRMVDLTPANYEAGLFRTKKYGDYLVIPEGVYRLKGAGGVIAFADERIGVTLPTELAAFFEELKKAGVKPEEFATAIELIKQGKEEIELETKDGGKIKVAIAPAIKNVIIPVTDVHRRSIVNLQTVADFFIYNINPNLIRARIERAAAEIAEMWRRGEWGKYVLWITILLIVGAIAYTMVKANAVQTVASTAKGMAATAKAAATTVK